MKGYPLIFWFMVIFLVWSLFGLILCIILRFSMNKIIQNFLAANDEYRKEEILSYRTVMAIYKIMFWLIPLNLILIPFLTYKYDHRNFYYIFNVMLMMYVILFEAYLFKRDIVRAVEPDYLQKPPIGLFDSSPGIRKKLKFIYRFLSIPALLVAILFFLDCIVPARAVDLTVVEKKYVTPGKLGDYKIKAKGKGYPPITSR